MKKALIVLLAVSLFVVLLLVTYFKNNSSHVVSIITPDFIKNNIVKKDVSGIKTFESEADFKNYLAQNEDKGNYYSSYDTFNVKEERLLTMSPNQVDSSNTASSLKSSGTDFSKNKSTRSSKTNVQVVGIDEPDIVKTDGKNIFLAHERFNFPYFLEEPTFFDEISKENSMISEKKIAPPMQRNEGIYTIKAIPPGDIQLINDLDVHGELLLENKNLVVLGNEYIYGYDISNSNTDKKWSIKINNEVQIETARLSDSTLYLLTKTKIKPSTPCPIRPLVINGVDIIIPCNTINYPTNPISADITYSLIKINVDTGELKDKLSFIGSQGNIVTYMSLENFYIAYPNRTSKFDIFTKFLLSDSSPIPNQFKEKITKLISYDISDSTKTHELEILIDTYFNTLTEDESLKFKNELENKIKNYLEEHIRKLENSSIVKVSLGKLQINNIGIVPGHLLNQFSIDEYKSNLRIATTIDTNEYDIASTNDVYIFDKKMKIIGSVFDMGKDERIYSVRFMEDKGYVVTFRETDPFYVLDLKSPASPKITGELKIPGYSSYLHSLGDDLILGIGEEDGKVKLSVFDVSNVTNPKETSKYLLDEYYSEAVNNHHAFLLDDKHNIFFLPGNKGGYIFTFENGNLEMKKAISTTGVRRALYINDYLYIISEDKIIILNENDWQKVQDFSLIKKPTVNTLSK